MHFGHCWDSKQAIIKTPDGNVKKPRSSKAGCSKVVCLTKEGLGGPRAHTAIRSHTESALQIMRLKVFRFLLQNLSWNAKLLAMP